MHTAVKTVSSPVAREAVIADGQLNVDMPRPLRINVISSLPHCTYGPFYGKKALRVKRTLSNIAKNDVMGKKNRIFVNTCARMPGPCAFQGHSFEASISTERGAIGRY